jgi:hypothetical protein
VNSAGKPLVVRIAGDDRHRAAVGIVVRLLLNVALWIRDHAGRARMVGKVVVQVAAGINPHHPTQLNSLRSVLGLAERVWIAVPHAILALHNTAGTDTWFRHGVQSNAPAGSLECDYFLSSSASATRACWPASDTAFMNASALLGVAAFPERILRNFMCFP